MRVDDLIKKIYLGDEGCVGLSIDFFAQELKIHTTGISFNLLEPNTWNYEKYIENGSIVFSQVLNYEISPMGVFGDDYIDGLFIESIEKGEPDVYTFLFKVGYGPPHPAGGMLSIRIKAREIWLEDPKQPGIKIVD